MAVALLFPKRSGRLIWILSLALLCAQPGWAQAPLTHIAEVNRLHSAEAKRGLPVRLRGIVTLQSDGNLVIEEDGHGIWISGEGELARQLWKGPPGFLNQIREGTEVEITGRTDAGGFSPDVLPESLRILGQKPLPPPRPMNPSRLFSGAEDCRRVTVRGVVQGYFERNGMGYLAMDANPGLFTIKFPPSLLPAPEKLTDAIISVSGVALSRFNTRGEFLSLFFQASSADEIVIEKPASPAEQLPLVPLAQLFAYQSEPAGPHRLRVAGVVTYTHPERFFYLQEGLHSVRVDTSGSPGLSLGDRVEVLGYADRSAIRGKLREPVIRKLHPGPPIEPLSTTPAQIIAINQAATASGMMAVPTDYDGILVRLPARLVAIEDEWRLTQPTHRLILEQGGKIFSAILAGNLQALPIGSELELSGVVEVSFEGRERTLRLQGPANFTLFLRNGSDIVVLRPASWWTVKRLLTILATLLPLFALAMLWAVLLRRKVAAQMAIISSKLRHEAVSEERNRLARDLHDTLEQQLSGISLQIDGAQLDLKEDPEAASNTLNLAGRMLRHTRLEARRSVWDLRSLVLESHGLEAALAALAEGISGPLSPQVEIRIEGTPQKLAEGQDYQLLRVAQEALANAIKHAQAKHIIIELKTSASRVELRIRDDGQGFSPEALTHSESPHFGVLGMQERAFKIGGELSIVGTPGHGCTVTLTLSNPPRSVLK